MDQDYVDKKIDAKIIEINNSDNIYEIGTVVNVKEFIIEVTGINNVMFYEKINIANKALGYVNSINESSVTVAVLKIDSPINVGDMVYSTNTLYMGAYSPSSFGRVIDLFGVDKLSGRKYNDLTDIPIERKTIPIMDRGTVNRPLLTGISGIDLMYPIGRGQRQLIIGDKRTGKTQIGLDAIVNQRGQNVLCFYVAIGKTKKEVKNIYNELMKKGALEYTTIITAFNDELPPVISLIPYFALSVAENYMMQGYDILVVIDDLKRHAEAYREISLISGKTPGRDAYPADIFYTHSRLLEKGCQHKNGGSITILPIVETKGGDITDYISTNVISITDGQIVLSDKAFQKGEKPAINYGLSVSRLGGAVQEKDMKAVGSVVRRKLLSYLETRSVYELVNMDEMSPELRTQFIEGKEILSKLLQYKFSPKTPQEMMAMFDEIVNGPKSPEEKSKDEKYLSHNKEDSLFDRNNGSQFDEPGSAVPVPNGGNVEESTSTFEPTPSVEKDISAVTVDEPVTAVPIEEAVTDPAFAVEEKLPNEVNLQTDNVSIETAADLTSPMEVPMEVPTEAPIDENSSSEGFELPSIDLMNIPNPDVATDQVTIPVTDMNVAIPETNVADEPVISMVIPEDATEEEVEDMIIANTSPTIPKMNDILDQVDLNQNVSIDVPGFEDDKPQMDEVDTVSVDYGLEDVAFELNENVQVDRIETSSDDGIQIDFPVSNEVKQELVESTLSEPISIEETPVESAPVEEDNSFAFSLNVDGETPEEEGVEDVDLSGRIVREAPDGEFDKDTDEESNPDTQEVVEESSSIEEPTKEEESTEQEIPYEEEAINETSQETETKDIADEVTTSPEEEVYSEEFEFDFPEESNQEQKEEVSSESPLEIPEKADDEVYSEEFKFDFPDEIKESEESISNVKEDDFVPFEKPSKKKSTKSKKNSGKKKSEEEVI